MILRFNPTGTHIHKGFLKVRVDLYPEPTDKTYAIHYVYVPVIPRDATEEQLNDPEWIKKLPHIWQLNPCLCHFITIGETTQPSNLLDFLNLKLNADTVKAIDDSLVMPNAAHLISSLMRDRSKLSDSVVKTKDFTDLISSVNERFVTLQALLRSGEGFVVEPQSIDIGTVPFDGASLSYATYTLIQLENSANATGTIDTAQIWMSVSATGFIVGTAYLDEGTTYLVRDSEAIGNVTAGAPDPDVFTGLTIDVTLNDYWACYAATGTYMGEFSGYAGLRYVSGDKLTDKLSSSYSLLTGDTVSVYGTGTEAGGVTHEGAATLSGVGTLTCIGRGIFIGKSTLSGTGTLASIGRLIAIGKATLSGTGTLAAIGRGIFIGKATLAGIGTLSAVVHKALRGAATLSGVGTLVAKGVITVIGKATLSGTGSLSVSGHIVSVIKLTLALYNRALIATLYNRALTSKLHDRTLTATLFGRTLTAKLYNRAISLKKRTE